MSELPRLHRAAAGWHVAGLPMRISGGGRRWWIVCLTEDAQDWVRQHDLGGRFGSRRQALQALGAHLALDPLAQTPPAVLRAQADGSWRSACQRFLAWETAAGPPRWWMVYAQTPEAQQILDGPRRRMCAPTPTALSVMLGRWVADPGC